MSSSTKPVILTLAFLPLLFTIGQSSCSTVGFSNMAKVMNITKCKKLTTLGAEFGWNYMTTSLYETRIDIILGASLNNEMGWLAWGVNPGNMPQMVGTRAIIGIRQQNASLGIKTYNITRDTKLLGCQLLPSENIDVKVSNMGVQYLEATSYLIINATLILPKDYNISQLNHVWQVGHYAEGVRPMKHDAALQNVDSTETIDLATGHAHSVGHHRRHLRIVHGFLNIVGWGVILPIGVIIARYFRTHPFSIGDTWFYLHVSCQITGYVLGTTGWGIGLGLGHASKYYAFHTHRLLGIFIFTFATLQILALRLKPKPDDDYRKHWNMYHHLLGYLLLAAISVNIFQGIKILEHDTPWKWAYIWVLAALAVITLASEIKTWTKFISKKKDERRASAANGTASNPEKKDESQAKAAQGTTEAN